MRRELTAWGRRLLLLALVLTPRTVNAESPWGLTFGMNGTRLMGDLRRAYSGALLSPSLGVSYRRELAGGCWLRTGIDASWRGGTRQGALAVVTISFDSTYSITDSIGRVERSWRAGWMDVPVVVERRFRAGRTDPYVFGRARGPKAGRKHWV